MWPVATVFALVPRVWTSCLNSWVTGGEGASGGRLGGLDRGIRVRGTNAIMDRIVASALGAGCVPCTVDIVLSHTVPRVSKLGPSRHGLLCAVCGVNLLANNAVGDTGVINEAVRLGPRNSTSVCSAVIHLSHKGRALLCPCIRSGNGFNGTCSGGVVCTTSHCARTGLTPVYGRLFNSVGGSAISFISGCSGAVGRPHLLPMAFPSILYGMAANVTIKVTSSVTSFGVGRIYRAAVTLVGGRRRIVSSALVTPSFINNKCVVCSGSRLGGVCSANENSIGIHSGCDCSGSTGYVSVARVPPAAASRTVVSGIVRLIGNGGVGRVSSVESRASLGNLGVAVSLGHNISTSGLVAELCGVAPLRSSFSYGFGILVSNGPNMESIGRLLGR